MSFKDIRPYFINALKTLSLEEWEDAFNYENIPTTKLDSVFHLQTTSFDAENYSHDVLSINVTVNVKTFVKGFRTPSNAYNLAIEKGENIMKACCKCGSSKTQSSIKDVKFSSIFIEPIDQTNDNIFQISNNFIVYIVIDIDA